MPCLSLRGVIAALAVIGPTIVAVVTLTLTLNASLTALRDMGREHSAALLRDANLRTGPVFQRPERMLKVMQNYTRSRVWEHPSDNSSVFERWDAIIQAVFLEAEMELGAFFTYFADNTAIGYFNADTRLYGMGATYPSSLRAAQALGLPRQTGGVYRMRMFNRTTHATAFAFEFPINDMFFSGDGTPAWDNVYLPLTDGGQASKYAPMLPMSTKFFYDMRYGKYPTPSVVVNIPIMAPLYRQNAPMTASNVYGITAYYMHVDRVDIFLATLQGTPNTRAFAVDSTGLIVASSMSRSDPHLTYENVTGNRPASPPAPNCLLTDTQLSDFGDFVVCRTYRTQYSVDTVRALPESLVHAAEPTVEFLLNLAGGKNYFAASARVATSFAGVQINLVLVFPEEDIIGDVVKSRNTSIGIAVAVVLAVALLSAAIVSWVLSPLEVIAGRMDRAADLEDDDTDRSLSPLHEIHALQEAYFAMNDELNRIRSFVPQSVLQAKQLRYEDEDADMGEGSNPRDMMSISGDAPVSTSDRRTDMSDTKSQATSHSRRSSRKSSRRYGGSSVAGEVVTTTLGCSLHSQLVSVLAFDAVGFHTAVEGVSAGAVLSHMAVVIDAVSAELRRTNGVLERFQGDHCTATYNAVRPCPAHARQAATAAWQITHTVQHIGLKLPHCAGVATGRCLVGNAGSDAVKTFAVLGSAYTQAMDLQRRCRDYGVPVLITARTYEDVSTTFEACFVDLVRKLPGSKRPALLAAITGLHSHGNDEGGSKNPTAGGGDAEWLYVVGGPESQLNVAFRELAQGRLEHAQALVAGHVPAVSTKAVSATSADAPGSTTAQEVQLPPDNRDFTTTAEWPARVRDAAVERLRTLSVPGAA